MINSSRPRHSTLAKSANHLLQFMEPAEVILLLHAFGMLCVGAHAAATFLLIDSTVVEVGALA
jgi:hypothetical protein